MNAIDTFGSLRGHPESVERFKDKTKMTSRSNRQHMGTKYSGTSLSPQRVRSDFGRGGGIVVSILA